MDPGLLLLPELHRLIVDLIGMLPDLALATTRAVGIVLILPVFSRISFGGLLRTALTLALAAPIVGYATDSLADLQRPMRTIQLCLIALKELFVGVTIGFMMSIPFWAIQIVGEIIDVQRGVSSEVAPVDPSSRSPASAMGLFLSLCGIALFVAADGLQTVVDMLYRSYAIWPLRSYIPQIDTNSALASLALLDRLMRFGLLVGGPAVIFLLLIDISVLLVGRFAPQFKPFDLAPAIKNVGFALFIAVYATFLFDYMRAEIATVPSVIQLLEGFVK
ncbi:type III secretion system export apparatus subunit SctT [Bradyrhizobium sp. Arg237L]|uniref:type III secretion system export apparatus subunit SctT n=1 Tax=Bradyrhizobium sp. Arg237L TaxID=3003352 RepID=UPI00249ECBCB|nr:type III secretion system export apparatus subunit SctT [Bradyrhizobium sp. Arg237L]MDI4231925.1 type III secretion system export apparatus subunit SctT [Bradyrhizobium sp. Arg237L]